MKVLLFGNNAQQIQPLVASTGFKIVRSNPEVVISFGGDGTLLSAERQYPGIPKLPIRDSLICKKCSKHPDQQLLSRLKKGTLKFTKEPKLKTQISGKDFYALNDFVIRNRDAIHAIRFRVNDKFYIGDGVVISTPFGSTGYFKSITGKTFKSNFAIAFNNTTRKKNPVSLQKSAKVIFELNRGKAALTFDNSPDIYILPEGAKLTFTLSNKFAKIYDSSLRCPDCKVKRD